MKEVPLARTFFLTLLVVCLPSMVSAQAPESESRDYLLREEVSPEAGSVLELGPAGEDQALAAEAAAAFPVVSTIQYTSFDTKIYTLRAYGGKYVRWALPDSWLAANGLNQNQIRELVDLTDLLYAHMAEVVGGEPSGDGLLTIAAVDPQGYAGLGFIGAKGLEVAPWTLEEVKKLLAVGQIHPVVYHELAHNFDIYDWPVKYLNYYNDFSHAWTHFLHYYLLTYSRSGEHDLTPGASEIKRIRESLGPWDAAGAAASWEVCVRNGGGCESLGVHSNAAWGGILMRYGRLHGPAAVRRAFEYLRQHRAQGEPAPQTPEDKNDLLVKALAHGAGANVLCELDAWRWAASPAARAGIGQQYPAQNPFCADGDSDGYSRATGDYNDANPAVRPKAAEVANGVDDDCNDIVDDLLKTETAGGDFPNPLAVSYPGRIAGRITSGDADNFTFNLTAPRKVVFELCSAPDFQGWLFLYKSDGGWLDYQFVHQGSCSTRTYNLNEARTWKFGVALNSASMPGGYTLRYYEYNQWPAPWGTTAPPTFANGAYRLSATALTLTGAFRAPTHVRFWVEGFGFVGTVPYSQTAAYDWTPPAAVPPGTYGYRAQLLSNSTPVEAPTALQLFEMKSALSSLSLSAATVTGGGGLTGTVTLGRPAPAAGAVVTLSDNIAATSLPASVTVAPGTTSKTFAVATSAVTAVQSGAVTAAYNGVTKSASLNVTPTYTVSGAVRNGTAGLGGVKIRVTSPAAGFTPREVMSAPTTGAYSFAGLPHGRTYLVAPVSAVYNFTPASITLTSLSSNKTGQNFSTLSRKSYSVSGRLTLAGAGLNGLAVQLKDPAGAVLRTAVTATSAAGLTGSYSFANVPAGLGYVVAPAPSAVYTFTPNSRAYTNLSAAQAGQSFTAARRNYPVSGRVLLGAAGLNGVPVQLRNGAGAVVATSVTSTTAAGGGGTYTFPAVPAGLSYTVAPAASSVYSYTPAPRTYTNLSAPQMGQNFAAARRLYAISGKVLQAGGATSGVAGVTMTLVNSATNAVVKTGMTASDGTGNYTLAGVPAGVGYTLRPSKAGATFTPASKAYPNLSANQSAQNFSSP